MVKFQVFITAFPLEPYLKESTLPYTGLHWWLNCPIFLFCICCIFYLLMAKATVHGVLEARISKLFVIPFSRILPNCGAGEDS